MSFLFTNKTLLVFNLKTRTDMNAKISVLFVLKRSYICYYIIYMTAPLTRPSLYFFNPFYAAGIFLYPLKTSENHQRFPDTFREYRKMPVAWNGIRQFQKTWKDWQMFLKHISEHCSLYIPPKKHQKQEVFWFFYGVMERECWPEMC